jgi:hypothetical protein
MRRGRTLSLRETLRERAWSLEVTAGEIGTFTSERRRTLSLRERAG